MAVNATEISCIKFRRRLSELTLEWGDHDSCAPAFQIAVIIRKSCSLITLIK